MQVLLDEHKSRSGSVVASRRPSRPPKVLIYSEHARALNFLGHFLILRFGSDAVAQHWGAYRSTELAKFVSGRVRFWRCERCAAEVECPESRCTSKLLEVRLDPQAPAGAGAVGGGGGGGGMVGVVEGGGGAAGGGAVGGAVGGAAGGAAGSRVRVFEQELFEHMPGRVWTLGQQVHVRRAGGGLAVGRLTAIGRCKGRQGGGAVRSRPGCFVLLLARDGSHGLDLSMVTNLFLLDKIWDPAVEKQARCITLHGTLHGAMHGALRPVHGAFHVHASHGHGHGHGGTPPPPRSRW